LFFKKKLGENHIFRAFDWPSDVSRWQVMAKKTEINSLINS